MVYITVISIVLVCFSLISKTLSFRVTIIMVVSIYVVALILSQKLRVVGDREIHKHDTIVYPSITDRQKKKIAEATPECNDTSKPNGTCTVTKFEEREENPDCQTNEHCIVDGSGNNITMTGTGYCYNQANTPKLTCSQKVSQLSSELEKYRNTSTTTYQFNYSQQQQDDET